MAGGVLGDCSAGKAAKLFSLSGLFPVYKPKGPTSADVLNRLKERLLAEAGMKQHGMKRKKQVLKIGHGGTLDSAASGVLALGGLPWIDFTYYGFLRKGRAPETRLVEPGSVAFHLPDPVSLGHRRKIH